MGKFRRIHDIQKQCQYYLDKGAEGHNVNDKKNDGVSSIISASYGGFIDAVKLLLDKGADVNAKCQNHETALMSASDKGHLDVVSMLIEKGADINAKSIDGDTALAKAANKRIVGSLNITLRRFLL